MGSSCGLPTKLLRPELDGGDVAGGSRVEPERNLESEWSSYVIGVEWVEVGSFAPHLRAARRRCSPNLPAMVQRF